MNEINVMRKRAINVVCPSLTIPVVGGIRCDEMSTAYSHIRYVTRKNMVCLLLTTPTRWRD